MQTVNIQQIYPPSHNPKHTHFYWIDLIRFLAAFAVLASHFRGAFFVDYASLPVHQQTLPIFCFFSITRLGHEAVLIFFILSGFLVGGKSIERILNKKFRPLDYSIDRIVRIMLPLISSLLLFIPVCLWGDFPIYPKVWIGNLFSLQGIACAPVFETLWSLSYEVWFYILMCAVGYSILYKGTLKGYIGLITLIISLSVFTKLESYYLFIWFIGAFGYLLIPNKSRILKYGAMIFSLIFLIILQLSSGGSKMLISISPNFVHILEIIFCSVFCIFMVQSIQNIPSTRFSKKLNRIGTRLAAFSYTLYLTHIPVRDILVRLGAPKSQELTISSVGLYILWLSIALSIAYCIYWIFERNTSKVKIFIKSRITHKNINSNYNLQ